MRTMTAEQAGDEIRRSYNTWKSQGGQGWMPTREILDRADLSLDETAAGIRHLLRTENTFTASDDPARLEWTAEDKASQIPLGRELIGLIIWA